MQLRRFVLLALPAFLFAAEPDTQLRSPNLRALPPQQFDQLLRQGLEKKAQNLANLIARNSSGTNQCAIPLLNYRVEHPERYTLRRMPVEPQIDHMAAKPMPVCKP